MIEYQIFKIVDVKLFGEMAPTYFLDVKTTDGWKNVAAHKSMESALIQLRVLQESHRREVMEINQDKFYMVLRRTGGSAPTKRHGTKEEAIKEASRLARQSNEEYFILEVIGKVKPVEIPVEFAAIEAN